MIKSKPLISFLIINYNNNNLLNRSINSCLKQSYKNFEILVFDDQSQEPITKNIKKYKSINRIKFYLNKKKKYNIPAFDAANAYDFLIKKSKGQIISFLDSDDYISSNKALYLVKVFNQYKNISLIQNLFINKNSSKKIYNSNSSVGFFPYLAPESCISFKKNFYYEYQKNTKKFKFKFNYLWLGFRMGVYSYYKAHNFYQLDKILTFYENFGESLKFKKFNFNWWIRRRDSFTYTYLITNKKNILMNLDYFVTKLVVFFLKLIRNDN